MSPMIKRMTIPSILAAILLIAAPARADKSFEVVVPAKAPSRPAHFNWTFKSANGKDPQVGQFACGSYWVAPAEGDAGVTFVSLKGNPDSKTPDLLSCDADPVTEKHGLLNGKRNYGSHDPAENVLARMPVTYTPAAGSCVSLVAAMQRDEAATSPGGAASIKGEVVDAYCVVTVMPKAPKNAGKDMIRPNITGATKEFLTWDDFALDRLPRHAFLHGRTPEQWEAVRRRWSHASEVFSLCAEIPDGKGGKGLRGFSEGGRAFRAVLLVSNYASGTSREFHDDLLTAFSAENKREEMKPALAAMLSYGLDIYHARFDYGQNGRKSWASGAGQWLGQYPPAVFLAALQKDEAKAHQLRRCAITNHSPDDAERGPQELRQVRRGVTGVLLWGDGHPILRPDGAKGAMQGQDWRYWSEFVGWKCYDGYEGKSNPNTGKKTGVDPYGFIDGPSGQPGAAYMSVSAGPIRAFAAAMILMPAMRSVVNTDAPIEYTDRVFRHGLWTSPDPVAVPAKADRETANVWFGVKGAAEWGKTWGVRPDDVRFAIEDGKGRFKSMHGKQFKAGYESGPAETNWSKIIALYDGAKFEDNLVPLGTVVAPEILFATGEKPEAHLSCPTPDAVIHYTLDGTEPTAASPAYDGKPIPVTAPTQVKAVAVHKEKKASAIRSAKVPAPLK